MQSNEEHLWFSVSGLLVSLVSEEDPGRRSFNSDLVLSQWTPLGFRWRDPNSRDDISKERFEGTVLRAIGRTMRKMKKEAPEDAGGAEAAPSLLLKVQKNPNESRPWFSYWWLTKVVLFPSG